MANLSASSTSEILTKVRAYGIVVTEEEETKFRGKILLYDYFQLVTLGRQIKLCVQFE